MMVMGMFGSVMPLHCCCYCRKKNVIDVVVIVVVIVVGSGCGGEIFPK